MKNAFFYGIVLAFGLIIPLGLQNIFIFNQGVSQRKFSHALPSALTAFVCDFILIVGAVLGVSVIVLTLPALKIAFFIIGLVFLISMGWITWKNSNYLDEKREPLTIRAQILFAMTVSILNPHALLDSIAVIGSYSLQFSGQEKYAFTTGCVLVSLTWFLTICFLGHLLKKLKGAEIVIYYLNKISALIMWTLAFYLAKHLWELLGVSLISFS